MAKPNTVGAADLAQTSICPQPILFMAGRFFVSADALPGDLRDDARALDDSARSILELAAWDLGQGGDLAANATVASGVAWGVLRLLEMASELRGVAESKGGAL